MDSRISRRFRRGGNIVADPRDEQDVFVSVPIRLGALLKRLGIAPTGGAAKMFLLEGRIRVNGREETRRGFQLLEGDRVDVFGWGSFRIRSRREGKSADQRQERGNPPFAP